MAAKSDHKHHILSLAEQEKLLPKLRYHLTCYRGKDSGGFFGGKEFASWGSEVFLLRVALVFQKILLAT